MIVRRITLHQFAGGSGRSVEFLPGLNVVLGPNEAGKTTLSSALRCVLFAGGPMNQVRFRTEIQPFLPVGIGNTARVALEFAGAGSTYLLERSWTAPKNVASRLQLPSGGELSDEEEIQRIVADSLGVTPGTYEHVLCVSQARLTETINRLAEEANGAAGGFGDVLRKSLYESDGIAIDLLVSQLERQISDHFGRWDRFANAPEKGRGLDAPWEKGAGIIVKAYYEYLRAKQAFEEAYAYEKKIDEFVGQEKSLADRRKEIAEKVAMYTPLANDAHRRAEFSVKLRECEKEAQELGEILDQWPRAEAELSALSEAIESLLARHKLLTTELNEAMDRTRTQALRTTYARAEALHNALVEEEQRLARLPPVTEDQIEALKKESATLQKLEIKISAHKLGLRIAAKAALDVDMKGNSGENAVHLGPGEEFSTTVAGKFSLSHRDWNLAVWSSEENAESLDRQLKESLDRTKSLLAASGAKTSEDAVLAWQAVSAQRQRVKDCHVGLNTLLENGTYEGLQRKVQNLPPASSGRDENDINKELLAITEDGGRKREREKELKRKCEEWGRKYVSRSEALVRFSLRKSEEQRLKEAMDQCQPLPQGFQSAESFLNDFESAQRNLHGAERGLTEIQMARLEYEKQKPKQSREELEEVLDTCRADFERAQRHGRAYLRIREKLDQLLGVMDGNLFEPYHQRVRDLLSAMTLRRHDAIQMQGNLPEWLGTPERRLLITQLSIGTVDVLAVAIRLAMAEVHLPPGDGFIVLDDPLVNLDPDRQKAAATCLREFARNHQVILLTCHPSHADLLGGATLELPLSGTADSRESL